MDMNDDSVLRDVAYSEEEETFFRSLFDPTSPLFLLDIPEPQGNNMPSAAIIRTASPQPPTTDQPQSQQQTSQEYIQNEVVDLVSSSDEDEGDSSSSGDESVDDHAAADDGEIDMDEVEDAVLAVAADLHEAAYQSARQYSRALSEVRGALQKAKERWQDEQRQQVEDKALAVPLGAREEGRRPRSVAEECPVCLYTAVDVMLAPCGHCICHQCVASLWKTEVIEYGQQESSVCGSRLKGHRFGFCSSYVWSLIHSILCSCPSTHV